MQLESARRLKKYEAQRGVGVAGERTSMTFVAWDIAEGQCEVSPRSTLCNDSEQGKREHNEDCDEGDDGFF